MGIRQWWMGAVVLFLLCRPVLVQAQERVYHFGGETLEESVVVQGLLPGRDYSNLGVWGALQGKPYVTLPGSQHTGSVYLLVRGPGDISVITYSRRPTLAVQQADGQLAEPAGSLPAGRLQRLLLTGDGRIISEDRSQQYLYHTKTYGFFYGPWAGSADVAGYYGLNLYGSEDGYQYRILQAEPVESRRVVGADGVAEVYVERFQARLEEGVCYLQIQLRDAPLFYTQNGDSMPNATTENLALVSTVIKDAFSLPVPTPTPTPEPSPEPTPTPTPTPTPAPQPSAVGSEGDDSDSGAGYLVVPRTSLPAMLAARGEDTAPAALQADGGEGRPARAATEEAEAAVTFVAAEEAVPSPVEVPQPAEPPASLADWYPEAVRSPYLGLWVYGGVGVLLVATVAALIRQPKKR